VIALLLTLIMVFATVGMAHQKDAKDEIPSIIVLVLAHEGPSLYDPYASEDEGYPQPLPVRIARGNSVERQLNILRLSISTVSPESVQKPYPDDSALLPQRLFQRQQVLRI
jgi:hypothetical protein